MWCMPFLLLFCLKYLNKEFGVFMQLLCAICNEIVIRRGYFCKDCYHTYRDDIINHAAWVKVCRSTEDVRRKQEAKEKNIIYLGDNLDIDSGGKLVFRDI